MTEEPEPPIVCYFCNPYAYPYRLDFPAPAVLVCEIHAELRHVQVEGRVLPPGWRPSWRRGAWA